MEAQRNRTRGSVAALAGQVEAFSGPTLFGADESRSAADSWKAGPLRVRTDTGINLDELTVEMIDGNYCDVKRSRRPVGRMPAEAH